MSEISASTTELTCQDPIPASQLCMSDIGRKSVAAAEQWEVNNL